MKSLKIAVVACSLFAAVAASAQTQAGAANAPQQAAQSNSSPAVASRAQGNGATPDKAADCAGPVSFCNIYFGS